MQTDIYIGYLYIYIKLVFYMKTDIYIYITDTLCEDRYIYICVYIYMYI